MPILGKDIVRLEKGIQKILNKMGPSTVSTMTIEALLLDIIDRLDDILAELIRKEVTVGFYRALVTDALIGLNEGAHITAVLENGAIKFYDTHSWTEIVGIDINTIIPVGDEDCFVVTDNHKRYDVTGVASAPLIIPSNAVMAKIRVIEHLATPATEPYVVTYTLDGTAPSTTNGIPTRDGDWIVLKGENALSNFKVISSDSGTLTHQIFVTYYASTVV